MTKKKRKAKKTATKKIAGKKPKRQGTKRKPKDAEQVHQDISTFVKSVALQITEAVASHAKTGQLAPAKYLLEMAGVYPKATDGTHATVEEDCLAKTLLDRLGPPAKVEAVSEAPLGEGSSLAIQSKIDSEAEPKVERDGLKCGVEAGLENVEG
jgi:hypothetical protein